MKFFHTHKKLFTFVLALLIEIYVLIEVGSIIGSLNTMLWIIGTFIAGILLIHARGISCMNRIQTNLQHGQLPALAICEEFLLLIAGLLLIFPGFLSDTMGVICLISPLRRSVLQHMLSAYLQTHSSYSDGSRQHIEIVEGEYKREDD